MKYRPPIEIRRGRVALQIAAHALNLPRLALLVDGDTVLVSFSYGNASSDPVLLVDVDLARTRTGALIRDAYWWWRNRRWYDPTHGRIDRDIQDAVAAIGPQSLGQRVAMEETAQHQRDLSRRLG